MYRYVCMTCVYVCHNITNLCFCVYQYLKTYLPLFFRGYADVVEKKLKVHGLVVECAHLPESMTLLAELEDASRRGVLYGIIISSQHEVHHSVTVHILHGTQQGKLPPLYCAQISTPCVILTNTTLLVLLGNNLSTVLYEAKCVLKLYWFLILSSKLKHLNRLRSSSNCNVFFESEKWQYSHSTRTLIAVDHDFSWFFLLFLSFFFEALCQIVVLTISIARSVCIFGSLH